MEITRVQAAADVTPEILDIARRVEEEWFDDEPIDWTALFDVMSTVHLANDTILAIDENSPAAAAIRAHIECR